MFRTRLISGAVLLGLAILFMIIGGVPLLIVVGALSVIAQYELYRVMGMQFCVPAYIGYAAAVFYYISLCFNLLPSMLVFTLFVAALMCAFVFTYPRIHPEDIAQAMFSFVYAPVMLSFIYLVRNMSNGMFLMALIFLCSWGCDTLAYCAGMLFGKHKMTPRLSPKKTVEGAIGGVVGAALLTVIVALIFVRPGALQLLAFAAIAAFGALFSMVGDLAASAIKRFYNVKDYGYLIPGHGGIMDRFDSVIFTAPLIYALCYVLQMVPV